MKPINKDFKYLTNRMSPTEKALILGMVVSALFGAGVFYLLLVVVGYV